MNVNTEIIARNPIRDIFFNEELHKYTDNLDNVYISSTTIVGEYKPKFDTKKMAANCHKAGLRGNMKYRTSDGTRALSEVEITAKWDVLRDTACDKGNAKHNYLEDRIKHTSRYKDAIKKIVKRPPNSTRLYTISDIVDHHSYGEIDLDGFAMTGIKDKYPIIYNAIAYLVTKHGYKVYAEIGVYSAEYLISGLIDLLLVDHNNKTFKILDWKTNIDDLNYKAGYFVKDGQGRRTTTFKETNEYFKAPLAHLQASSGNAYSLQLSLYAYLVEMWGFTFDGLILAHIRDHKYTEESVTKLKYPVEWVGLETVDFHNMSYLQNEIKLMINHYHNKHKATYKTQTKLFN